MVYSAVRINAAPGPWPFYFYRRVSPRPSTRPREIITKPFIFCRTVTVLITWSVRNKAGIHSEEKTLITTVNILGALTNESNVYPFCRTKVTRMYFFILHLSIADILTAFFTLLPEMIWDVCFGHSLNLIRYRQRATSRKSCLFSGNSLDVPSANRVTFCRNLAQVTFIVRARSILFIALRAYV